MIFLGMFTDLYEHGAYSLARFLQVSPSGALRPRFKLEAHGGQVMRDKGAIVRSNDEPKAHERPALCSATIQPSGNNDRFPPPDPTATYKSGWVNRANCPVDHMRGRRHGIIWETNIASCITCGKESRRTPSYRKSLVDAASVVLVPLWT